MSYYKDRRESAVLIKIVRSRARAFDKGTLLETTSCIRPDGRERGKITLQIRTLARRETRLTTGGADKSIDDVRKDHFQGRRKRAK